MTIATKVAARMMRMTYKDVCQVRSHVARVNRWRNSSTANLSIHKLLQLAYEIQDFAHYLELPSDENHG